MDKNNFVKGYVPTVVVAKVCGKDVSWVRAGIIFYISPKLLWEKTGYLWKGEKP